MLNLERFFVIIFAIFVTKCAKIIVTKIDLVLANVSRVHIRQNSPLLGIVLGFVEADKCSDLP